MLILNEDGKVISTTDKTIDELKRDSYKHSIQEQKTDDEFGSFVDSLEAVEEGEDIPHPAEDLSEEGLEAALLYAEFKTVFLTTFGESPELFDQFDSFFRERHIDLGSELTAEEVPGMKSSEQSIVTSEVEDK